MKKLALFLLAPLVAGCGRDPYPSCKALAEGYFSYASEPQKMVAHLYSMQNGRLVQGAPIKGSDLSIAWLSIDGDYLTPCRYDFR